MAITQQSIRDDAERFIAQLRSGQPPTRRLQSAPQIIPRPQVGSELNRILATRFGVSCTRCFAATVREMNSFTVDEVRGHADDYAKAIGENAREGQHTTRLIEWAKGDSLAKYKSLVIEACDACETTTTDIRGQQNAKVSRVEFDGPISLQRTQELESATRSILQQLPPTISGVAGVPRSGMYPAALLSMWLHVPLYEVSPQHGLQAIGFGSRGRRISVDAASPLLVVDDSIYRGGTMQIIKQKMEGRPAIYAAAFVRPESRLSVDIAGQLLSSPHLFTWNLFNNGILHGNAANPALRGGMALDFDGVLCEDCSRDGDDSEEGTERYRQWILNAKPKWLPRLASVPLIVTFRQERFRPETEAWMSRWGITCDSLVMDQSTTFSTRLFDVAKHKGETFRESKCCLFIESSDMQAGIIHRVSGKPVIVPDSGRVYQ